MPSLATCDISTATFGPASTSIGGDAIDSTCWYSSPNSSMTLNRRSRSQRTGMLRTRLPMSRAVPPSAIIRSKNLVGKMWLKMSIFLNASLLYRLYRSRQSAGPIGQCPGSFLVWVYPGGGNFGQADHAGGARGHARRGPDPDGRADRGPDLLVRGHWQGPSGP